VASNTEIDPVCGMPVDTEVAVVVRDAGDVYYFCETVCADTFRDDPIRWAPDRRTAEATEV
jgi:Cu+-exporting ATPase